MRFLTRISGIALAVMALGTVAALVTITTYLHGVTRQIRDNLQSVRAAEQIELQVLLYARETRLAAATKLAAHTESAQRAADAIRLWQGVAGNYIDGADEARVTAQLGTALDRYFKQAAAAANAPPGTSVPPLDAFTEVQALAERLLNINLAHARQGEAAAAFWDSVSNLTGLVTAGIVLLTVAALIFATETQVRAPLLELQRSIRRFAGSHPPVRAAERGPFEVREIARVFNEMAETIERHRQQQLGFLAGVAHDLRNPLSAIKVALGTIPPSNPRATEEHVAWTVGMIGRQVDLLSRMISDLLDAARVEAGHFELRLEDHDLCELVQHVVALFSPLSERHQLLLKVPAEAVLTHCDPARLEQVLNNLVSNAIKYSPDGGPVEVIVDVQGSHAVVSVTDRGLGIAAEEQAHIFEPFRRGDASRESIPGVGIGLSVAKRIVEAHRGTITVHSTVGEGSTFAVRLPLAGAGSGLHTPQRDALRPRAVA